MITTSRLEKNLIREQARAVRAKRILEIGAFKGETTAVLNQVANENDGYVVVIDPMKWASKPAHFFEWLDGKLHPFSYETTFWRNVERSGQNRVKLHRALSTDPELIANPAPELAEFDLVFIDGEHTYEGVRADLDNWGRRARAGGRILMHDVIPRFPGVQRAAREVQADQKFQFTWPTGHSVGVVQVLEAGAKPAMREAARSESAA
jgi:predicted O-methyltransferase YrrM